MKLFATFYLDEDVSVLVATLLRARGFDVVTARDEKMLAQEDIDHLTRAVTLERCVFTHNRVHFENLHREYIVNGKSHFGIIIGSQRGPYELARRLAVLLNVMTADEIENQLLYI